MDVFSYSDFLFAENLFNLNREEIIEKYSTMGLIDPINLRSFLSVVAKEIDKAKPAEEQRKFKVINLISDIVDNIEPFELALSLSFRKDSRNITSPDVRFFQRVLAGNIPIKSFLPVQNEILSGGSSERIKNLVYRWADTIYFNADNLIVISPNESHTFHYDIGSAVVLESNKTYQIVKVVSAGQTNHSVFASFEIK